ncbi:MAG TPA: CobD/CbiB family protein [Burkholderiales bacterium]|jgi:adenosylcobinamide-phosphate synthase|nr:CobD/CbiB family protein [Burkholderiales bacterium]
MKFLALLVALVLEQVRPLRERDRVDRLLQDYAAFIERHANAGEYRHGLLAWIVFVGSIAAATAIVFSALCAIGSLLGLLWSVAVLYVTLGFRRFSDHFSEIEQALRMGDLDTARESLARWRGVNAAELASGDIARAAIEQGLLVTHRQVFGTMAWFVIFGPAGAVVYHLAAQLAETWGRRGEGADAFGRFATRAFYWIDWVPARLTAAGLAVVGNFEDAVYCWRMQAGAWTPQGDGIILASGAGALGVRLGGAAHGGEESERRPELGTGVEADLDRMPDAAGLIWKALVVWLFVILVVSIAHALG